MYDFDTVIDRRGTNSIKWDVAENELPMWVADMDFKAAPAIRKALEERIAHGIFGYADVNDAWRDAYCHWWGSRHGLEIEKDWLLFSIGVVPTISSVIRKLTSPAEKILIQSPDYNHFYISIRSGGREVLDSPLVYENGAFSIDWADLESKLADPQTAMMILCNPHNPVGKIWDHDTLIRIAELAAAHGVLVLSDEIHCDITAPDRLYVPFLSVSDTARKIGMAAVAPTKCFNLAGLSTSAVIVPDPKLRHRVSQALQADEIGQPSPFAVDAAIAAFEQGGPWLDELRVYLWKNRARVEEYLPVNAPEIKAVRADATYLVWLDISALTDDSAAFAAFLRERTGLFVSNGMQYGGAGKYFLRFNIACPAVTLEDGLERLARGVQLWKEEKMA